MKFSFYAMTTIWFIDAFLMIRHCNAGVGGYPDVWDKKSQEFIHTHLVALFMMWLIIFCGFVIFE